MEKEIKLNNHIFNHVCKIDIARNIDGTIKEFHPEKKYENKYEFNKYGMGPFCRFSIPVKWAGAMGVYAVVFDNELVYIGQCVDLAKRYNQGYGQIQPRNCFIGGQSTNCKINKLILNAIQNKVEVNLFFNETNRYDQVESELIDIYNPIHNHQRGKKVVKNNRTKEKSYLQKITKHKEQMGIREVYEYLDKLLSLSKEEGKEVLEIVSGEVHKELGLVSRMPTVCDAMYKLMKTNDKIIYAPPKGKGSRLHIKYFL